MRMVLKVSIPVEAGNRAIKDGSLPKTMMGFVESMKPEACYFGPDGGKRTAFFVFDMKDTTMIPTVGRVLRATTDSSPRDGTRRFGTAWTTRALE